MLEGSRWFRRFYKECRKLSKHIYFKRIKYGFYRLYWTGGGQPAYIHEVYKEMPYRGYDINDKDIRLQSFKYYQEYEDSAELTRNIKNFVEGYVDSMGTLRKRVYMLKNDKEFYKNAVDAYKQVRVK